MKFKKQHAIAFISIITAINIALLISSYFIPFASMFLLIIIPLASTIVSIKCNKKYILIYILATALISLVDFQEGLFTVIPALISGSLFGIFIDLKIHGFFTMGLSSIVNSILLLLATLLINKIYDVDMVQVTTNFLMISKDVTNIIYLIIIYFISLLQSIVNYIISQNELKKFNVNFDEKPSIFYETLFINILFFTLTIIFAFFFKEISLLFLSISVFISLYLSSYIFLYYKKKFSISLLGSLLIIGFFINLMITSKINAGYEVFGILTYELMNIITCCILIIYEWIKNHRNISWDLFVNK